MVINPRVSQQRAVFRADTPGDRHHLFHFRLNHRHVARIKGQLALTPGHDIVAIERVFTVLQLHFITAVRRQRQVITVAGELHNAAVNLGAELAVILKAGFENHPGVAVGAAAGGDIFPLPAHAAVGGQVGVHIAIHAAVHIQRAGGVAGIKLGIRAAAEGFAVLVRHAGAEPVAERQREIERNIFPGAGAAVAVIKALYARAQAQRSP